MEKKTKRMKKKSILFWLFLSPGSRANPKHPILSTPPSFRFSWFWKKKRKSILISWADYLCFGKWFFFPQIWTKSKGTVCICVCVFSVLSFHDKKFLTLFIPLNICLLKHPVFYWTYLFLPSIRTLRERRELRPVISSIWLSYRSRKISRFKLWRIQKYRWRWYWNRFPTRIPVNCVAQWWMK